MAVAVAVVEVPADEAAEAVLRPGELRSDDGAQRHLGAAARHVAERELLRASAASAATGSGGAH